MSSRKVDLRIGALAQAVALALLATTAGIATAQTSATADVAPAPKNDDVRLGTVVIVGTGDRLGAGQMLNEDSFKGRSTVTKSATEKDLPTGNFYQAMSLLPGVNTFSHDATGLFGGGMTMRGFNSDQLGLTINGAPVNDSGNFAVYPMEYTDQENLCLQSVAQGNPDVESPHVGATGGSVSLISCDPEDKKRVRASQTVGGLHLRRTYLRVDTGRFADDKAKVFLSYSHTEADKWKGLGGAQRDHVDAAFSLDLGGQNKILGSVLYNRAVNNNIYTMSVAQLNANGYYWDYSSTLTGRLPGVNGTRQAESGPNPQYYQLALNPFENVIASVSGSFKLADNVFLKVQPYVWYGYGTGGTQQRNQSETGFLNRTTGLVTAGVDLNRDGDTLDQVIVASSSVTRTTRPGVTSELKFDIANHQLRTGIWYERAEHRQTGPAVLLNANGDSTDVWLRNNQILRPDGTPFESRDWLTVSPAYQAYVSDVISVLGGKGEISAGLRAPHVTRNFTNTASEAGGNSLISYNLQKTFSDVLPQLGARYNLTAAQQVFANIGKNFRAPPNFALAPTNNNVTFANGVPTLAGSVVAETSIVTDVGYRYQSSAFSASATAFNVNFSNRQANAYDPILDKSIYTNAGNVSMRGVEAEFGTVPVNGISAYVSLTAQDSEVKNDISPGKNQSVPTTGKQFPLTPQTMAGLSLQYAAGPVYARLRFKTTGRQYATLMNDELVPSYTVGSFDAGYRLGDLAGARNVQLRLNVSNIGDVRYRNPSSGTVINAVPVGGASASTVFYYLGAPRLLALTLSADF